MPTQNIKPVMAILSVLLIAALACGISFDLGEENAAAGSPVEQTLQAIYA